jgi:hypothetical protein
MEQQAREQAFITVLTTEHFVLQSTRSATIGEANSGVGAGSSGWPTPPPAVAGSVSPWRVPIVRWPSTPG